MAQKVIKLVKEEPAEHLKGFSKLVNSSVNTRVILVDVDTLEEIDISSGVSEVFYSLKAGEFGHVFLKMFAASDFIGVPYRVGMHIGSDSNTSPIIEDIVGSEEGVRYVVDELHELQTEVRRLREENAELLAQLSITGG